MSTGGSSDQIPATSRLLLLLLVLGNVSMQLVAAWLLKIAPPFAPAHALMVAFFLGCVLFLNVGRFWLWGQLHKHYPISVAYPASALLFPGILVMAWYFGEPIGVPQVVGAAVVLTGVGLLLSEDDQTP